MKEGNLTIPTRDPHRTIITTLANRNISLSNLNMKEGNLTMPTRDPHSTIVTTLAIRNISLSNKKKRMLEYNKILYIISPALKKWKRKFRRI